MTQRVPVTFLPMGVTVDVEPGTTLLRAAMEAAVVLPAPCGGRGRCGRCAVTVVAGELATPDEHEASVLARLPDRRRPIRLACRACVTEPVSVKPVTVTSHAARSRDAGAAAVSSPMIAAVDLGTTSVTARIVDPGSGARIAEATTFNRQLTWGLDVLSRITAALDGESDALARAARESVAEAIGAACATAGVTVSNMGRLVIAANPAMASLLVGADVSGLAAHPFSAALDGADLTPVAGELGADEVILVPGVNAFVGGDLVAGLVAAGLAQAGAGELYLDIGTNAEIALVAPDRLVVASAPAGPAFEGWGIACGGGAGPGGVRRVDLVDGEFILDARGYAPTHLTGSGLMSAVAALRGAGQILADGSLAPDGPLARHVFNREGVRAIALGTDPDADGALFITQLDIRALQSAKGAVTAAVRSVLAEAGRDAALGTVIVSGAFGEALDERDLTALGIVPQSSERQILVDPDAALRGAAMIAFDEAMLDVAYECALRAHHIDLAASEGFANLFVESLALEPYDV